MLGDFWRSKRGNFGMMFAAALPMMLGAVGLAVDYTSMLKARSKLQDALDAAVLAASRINDKTISREQVFQDFMAVNLQNEPGLRNVVAEIDIDTGLNYIDTSGIATADVDLTFAFIFGADGKVSATASAYEARNDLEVVLALDNTGSMGEWRMKELRKAATSLVEILSAVHSPDAEPQREVRIGLVPFVTAVNVKGEGFKDTWIDGYKDAAAGISRPINSQHHGTNFKPKADGSRRNHFDMFSRLDLTWKGCVEARPAPYNLSDAAPDSSQPDTQFVPYFAPDEPGVAQKSGDSGTKFNNTYLNDMVTGTQREIQQSVTKYATTTPKYIVDSHVSLTNGPNYACPTPIVPLTSDFAKLKTEISKMIHWYGSGTNVSEGLAWAMRVLSPGEPYTQGDPFKDKTAKFAVVFTDGENNVYGASSEAINKSDYGSYSFADQGRMDDGRAKSLAKVNAWTLEICTALKNQEVEVFTVLLGADTAANRTLYSACATRPENYYPTSDVSQLDAVFRKIGSQMAQLYLTN